MKRTFLICLIFCLVLCSCGNEGVSSNQSSGIAKNEKVSSSILIGSDISSEIPSANLSSENKSSSNTQTSSKKEQSPSVSKEDEASSKTETSSKKEETPSNKPSVSTSSNPSSEQAKPNAVAPAKIPIIFSSSVEKTPLTPLKAEDYYALGELKKSGSDAEIKAYKLFAQKIGNYEDTIEFDFAITDQQLLRAYYHYTYDYPQHFWRGTQTRRYSQGGYIKKVVVEGMLCGGDKEKIKKLDESFNSKVNQILSKLSGKNTELEKEIYIHNYIVNNTDYTANTENAHNAYGALVEGKGVCEAYSKAFMVLMRQAGVQCILVDGTLIEDIGMGTTHEWNMVKIGDEFYHVDVTADDPIVDGGQTSMLKFNYFNMSDNSINHDHKIENNSYNIPDAPSSKYHFFDYYGIKFKDLNVETFAQSIAFSVKNELLYSHAEYEKHIHDEINSFLQNNYYDIIKRANELLGEEKVKADGKISFIIDEANCILSMRISY